jgi:hypothetical protein
VKISLKNSAFEPIRNNSSVHTAESIGAPSKKDEPTFTLHGLNASYSNNSRKKGRYLSARQELNGEGYVDGFGKIIKKLNHL